MGEAVLQRPATALPNTKGFNHRALLLVGVLRLSTYLPEGQNLVDDIFLTKNLVMTFQHFLMEKVFSGHSYRS